MARGASGPTRVTAGGWQHGPAPGFLPAWAPCAGFAGVLFQEASARSGPENGAEIFVRAVVFAERNPWFVVVVDVPVAGAVKTGIETATGIVIGPASAVALTPLPVQGRAGLGHGRRTRGRRWRRPAGVAVSVGRAAGSRRLAHGQHRAPDRQHRPERAGDSSAAVGLAGLTRRAPQLRRSAARDPVDHQRALPDH
ncbi:MAG: hypothetical protein MZW92_07580 [Comamonadaceae bacterium]|nr:hypothetical protein [Comamonadaceae bacterium]